MHAIIKTLLLIHTHTHTPRRHRHRHTMYSPKKSQPPSRTAGTPPETNTTPTNDSSDRKKTRESHAIKNHIKHANIFTRLPSPAPIAQTYPNTAAVPVGVGSSATAVVVESQHTALGWAPYLVEGMGLVLRKRVAARRQQRPFGGFRLSRANRGR